MGSAAAGSSDGPAPAPRASKQAHVERPKGALGSGRRKVRRTTSCATVRRSTSGSAIHCSPTTHCPGGIRAATGGDTWRASPGKAKASPRCTPGTQLCCEWGGQPGQAACPGACKPRSGLWVSIASGHSNLMRTYRRNDPNGWWCRNGACMHTFSLKFSRVFTKKISSEDL